MKISDMIRVLRRQQGLTQEQVAEYIGVSTPAVNKWEKGNTYPDITLLPALARLLKTDLNTLLSFRDDLSDTEVQSIEKTVMKIIHEKGYAEGFQAAIEKIREYPTCEPLIFTLTNLLENTLSLAQDRKAYKHELECFYERMSKSEQEQIRSEAIYKLSASYIERGELDKAEQLIHTLEGTQFDNKVRVANLYLQQGYLKKAAGVFEHRLLEVILDLQAILGGMMKIALKEDRRQDAQQLADICQQITLQFDMMECTAYITQFEYASETQDVDLCITALEKLTNAMTKEWDITDSLFFRQLTTQDINEANHYRESLLPVLVRALELETELDFLRSSTDFQKLIKRLKRLMPESG